MGKGPKVKCMECGQVLQSRHVHNWVACECWGHAGETGGFFIDGGGDYFRFGGHGIKNMRFEDENGDFTKTLEEFNK